MKIKKLSFAILLSIITTVLAVNTAQAQKYIDVIGNPPYGSDPVSGVIGSGATPRSSTRTMFAEGTQERINAVSANLTVTSLSGSQAVGGNTINVDSSAAETVLAVINSPVNSDSPARSSLVAALGGGDAAQQLARSMQGLRNGDGSVNAVILTEAVDSYHNYMRSVINSSQVIQRPAIELDGFIQGLPPGQKATQVVLAKLVEASR